MNKNSLQSEFQLPCGAILKNRLVKSAMTERISDKHFEPTEGLVHLYEKWVETNAGLLITGNVLVDRKHLESAGNVCFDDEKMLPKLKQWAAAAKKNSTHIWTQISHSGRQTNRFVNLRPFAPSEVQLKKIGLFGKPRAMSETDIQNVIKGFVKAAKITKEAGFTGLQIHAAHGYLLSQFLSPITNQRTDRWGGSLENRSRLLMTIIEQVREVVGAGFPIGVKLNSSDFQKGGLTEEESIEIIRKLDEAKIDLLEISGGTYEKLAFFILNDEKSKLRESTKRREAYFIDFSKKVRAISNLPLLITGGFRSYDFCNEVLQNGELDFIGMARPFITDVDDIPDFLKGKIPILENKVIRTGIKEFEEAAEGGYYAAQIIRLSRKQKVQSKMNPLWASNFLILHEFKKAMINKFFGG